MPGGDPTTFLQRLTDPDAQPRDVKHAFPWPQAAAASRVSGTTAAEYYPTATFAVARHDLRDRYVPPGFDQAYGVSPERCDRAFRFRFRTPTKNFGTASSCGH